MIDKTVGPNALPVDAAAETELGSVEAAKPNATQVPTPNQAIDAAQASVKISLAVPGYDLREEIGRGGMGVVYRAFDVGLQRDVAVKILKDQFSPDSDTAARFLEEARITGQLQHPGIPAVHQAGTLPDGRPYLAMKLIRGRTLDELMKSGEAPNTLATFEALCQAVGYAHAHGVIHRDLKPANVMVGRFGEVQVMDWGLAKVLASAETTNKSGTDPDTELDAAATVEIRTMRDSETAVGNVMGTPAYMAPEQAAGKTGTIDSRSDVFGLGAVLCSLLTGRPPFAGLKSAAHGATEDAFARLDACGADPEVVALCKRCLAFDPTHRPANGGAVAVEVAALRSAADDRAKQAELNRARAEVQAREQRKRRRVLQFAGSLLAAVLLAGIAGTTLGMLRARTAREDAKSEQAKAEKAEDETLAAYRASTDDAIQELIGSKAELGPKEREYLEKTRKRWQEFAERQGDDERSQRIRGEGHFEVAGVWQRLGRRDEARAEYIRAIDIQKELARRFPELSKFHQELAASHHNLGMVLAELGMRDEARSEYEQARDIHINLAAMSLDLPDSQRDLAYTHQNLGLLLERLGKPNDAGAEYATARDIQKKLSHDFPSVPDYQMGLAYSYNNLGRLLSSLGKREDARAEYEQARTILKKLADSFPAQPKCQVALATTHNNLGLLLRELGKREQARVECELALGIRKAVANAFPALPDYQNELAKSHNSLGVLLADLGEREEASTEYRRAQVIQKKLADSFPKVPQYRQDLASTHNNLGLLLDRMSQRDAAHVEFKAALDIKQQLAASSPDVPEYGVQLAGSYCNFGNLIRRDGKPADSLQWFQKAIQTLKPIHEHDERGHLPRQFLRSAHSSRAKAHDELKMYAEAMRDWDRAVQLAGPKEQLMLRSQRAFSYFWAGRVADAIIEIGDLTKLSIWNGSQWYHFSYIYAVASTKVADKKQEYADRAMEMLQKAVRAGFKDTTLMAKDENLDPLREREDFKKLLESLKRPK